MVGKFTLIHLSDLHYHGEYDQAIVINSLLADINAMRDSGTRFDVLIFSGDLTSRGNDPQLFDKADVHFITNVLTAADISRDRFVISPGNHDIDRDVVRNNTYIELGLQKTLTDRAAVNHFIEKYWSTNLAQLPPAFSRASNFYTKWWPPSTPDDMTICPFCQVYKVRVNDTLVGIACLNTAWRATGEPDNLDYGKLLIGERTIDLVLEQLSGCQSLLAVFHHPLNWLCPFDEMAVDARLQANFDLILYGHVHQNSPLARATTSGETLTSQGGCLYQSRDYFNGYSIITVDATNRQVVFNLKEYSDATRTFINATRIVPEGIYRKPMPSPPVHRATSWSSVIRIAAAHIRRRANKQITLAPGGMAIDIDTHFICPTLYEGSNASAQIRTITDMREADGVDLDTILKDTANVIFVGGPDSGKTSLAHYIAFRAATGVVDAQRLPLICSFRDVTKSPNAFWKLVQAYAQKVTDPSVTRQQVEREKTLIIVDNVDMLDEKRMEWLGSLENAQANARWIWVMGVPSSALAIGSPIGARPGWRVFNLRELSRRAVRVLSAGWLESPPEGERTDTVFRSVMAHIRRTGLPRTGYIVALMLWAVKNRSQGELLNEAVLLQNIIDHLLGRMDYTGALRSEFDFTSKTAVLQELALWYKKNAAGDEDHEDKKEDKNAVVGFVINFLESRGLKYDAAKIVESFIDVGILSESGARVSFKYRRFREFFIAGLLRDDRDLFNSITGSDEWMNFARELDIFSARFRRETSLLKLASRQVQEMMSSVEMLDQEDLKEYLKAGPPVRLATMVLRKMRREVMSADQIDKIMGRAERGVQDYYRESATEKQGRGVAEAADKRITFIMALEIYSQFIRNLEFATLEEKEDHLGQCMEAWEQLLARWLTQLRSAIEDLRKDPEHNMEMMNIRITSEVFLEIVGAVENLAKVAVPNMVAGVAYHNIGSEKLTTFVKRICENRESSQLKKIMCTFILLELSPESALEQIRRFGKFQDWDKWTLGAVTQQLFMYYLSRPLSPAMRMAFEELVGDMEVALGSTSIGTAKHMGGKGKVMQKMKERAPRDTD